MKKQLCILLSISLFCPLYAQTEPTATPTLKSPFVSGKFNNATIAIQYKNFDGTPATRTMTTADNPIYMSGETTAAYLTQDTLRWFSRDMAIGMLIGIAGGFFCCALGSWLWNRSNTPRRVVKNPQNGESNN